MEKKIKGVNQKARRTSQRDTGAKFQGSDWIQLKFQKEIQEPYCNIVLLLIKGKKITGQKICLQGTGTLIKYNKNWYVLTAAHNVYNNEIKTYYEKMELYFIKKRKRSQSRYFRINIQINNKTCLFDPRFMASDNRSLKHKLYEIALIDINGKIKNLQDKPKGLQIQFDFKNEVYDISKQTLLISGYPFMEGVKKIQEKHQFYVQGCSSLKQGIKIPTGLKDYILLHQLSTIFGHSGAPVMAKNKTQQKWKIIGIHLGSLDDKKTLKPLFNFAVCFNKQSYIADIINQEYDNNSQISTLSDLPNAPKAQDQMKKILETLQSYSQSLETNSQESLDSQVVVAKKEEKKKQEIKYYFKKKK